MKRVFLVLVIILLSSFFTSSLHAQEGCAQIQSVSLSSSIRVDQSGTIECKVEVDGGHAGSHWIACGFSVNGSWPQNYCPSDTNFLGWNGNTASFRCDIPANAFKSQDNVEVVGFDFSNNCGPDTGKRKQVETSGPHNGNNPPSSPNNPNTPNNPNAPPGMPRLPNACENIDIGYLKQCKSDVECVKQLLQRFLSKEGSTAPGNPTGTSPSTSIPAPNRAGALAAWQELTNEIGPKFGIPPTMLMVIKYAETGLSYTDDAKVEKYRMNADQVREYSKPGNNLSEDRCSRENADCGEAGATQITTDRDQNGNTSCPNCSAHRCGNAWASYRNAVIQQNKSETHSPNPCNFRDNLYAAAAQLKIYMNEQNITAPFTQQEIVYILRRRWGWCTKFETCWSSPYDFKTDTGWCGPKQDRFNPGVKNDPKTYCWYMIREMNAQN